MRIHKLILLLGIVNATLYSALLPLWEGFDEAFHYAYVENLRQTSHLPILGHAMVPNHVLASLQLAPVSNVVHAVIPETTSYDTWVSLPEAEKARRREELDRLYSGSGNSTRPNYEAHHPPLTYLLLAFLDWIATKAPITVRVLILRLIGAVSAIVLLFWGTSSLCRTLELPERFTNAALLTIFCSQMLYATIAHVANDWLAVGVSAVFFAAIAEFVKKPDRRTAWTTALWLAVGLLTKAYFLVLAVLAFVVAARMIWRRRTNLRTVLGATILVIAVAGPWYARNLVLYRNVSGTQEEFDGIGLKQALAAAPHMNWPATIGYLARGSLWSGNNSFTSFSRSTLNTVLILLLLAVAVWSYRKDLIRPAEQMVFAAIVWFSIAVAYASCSIYTHTGGASAGASPWYTQVLLAPVVALAYLGMSRWRRFGTILGVSTLAIWTWVIIATWLVKLFPMYSGGGAAPMRIRDVWSWYVHGAAAHMGDLTLLALAPAPFLYAGLLVTLTITIFLSAAVIRDLIED